MVIEKKEIDTLSLFITRGQGEENYKLYSEINAESNKCAFNNPSYFVRLQVVAPENVDLLENFLANGTDKYEKHRKWLKQEKWIDEERLIQTASLKYQLFNRLFDNKNHVSNDRCFIVKILANDSIAKSGILTVQLQITAESIVQVDDYGFGPKAPAWEDITFYDNRSPTFLIAIPHLRSYCYF